MARKRNEENQLRRAKKGTGEKSPMRQAGGKLQVLNAAFSGRADYCRQLEKDWVRL